MTKLIQITLFFVVVSMFSQKQIILKGKVHFNEKLLSEVHIFSINSSKGTITNSNGLFELRVSLGDKLLITAMPYKEKHITITNALFSLGYVDINLLETINTLEEVVVDSRKLVGNLLIDSKNVPKDPNFKYKVTIDIKNYDLSQIPDTGSGADRGNEANNKIPSGVNILGLVGMLAKVAFPTKKIRKKPNTYTKETPSIMRKELGDAFFIKELKVPKVHIDDFLEEYCNTKEFIDLYEENKIIECITYFFEKNKLKKYVKI